MADIGVLGKSLWIWIWIWIWINKSFPFFISPWKNGGDMGI